MLGTFGVSSILLSGDKPARLDDRWVDSMKARENKEGFIALPTEKYKRGERVRIQAGLFSGHLGIYQGMTSKQREVVLLDMLGRVEIASSDLSVV